MGMQLEQLPPGWQIFAALGSCLLHVMSPLLNIRTVNKLFFVRTLRSATTSYLKVQWEPLFERKGCR